MISFSPHIILQSDRGFCWCCCLFLVFKFQSWNGRSERLSDFLSPTQQSRAGTSTRKSSFPNGSMVKNLPANAGEARDVGSVPGSERSPGVGNYDPLQYSCLENPHGQRSLVGYSLWSCKVGHDWARAHTHTHTHTHENVCLWLISNILSIIPHRCSDVCSWFRERDGKGRRRFIIQKRKAVQDPIKIQGTEFLFFQMHYLCLSGIHSFVLSNFFSKILRVSRFQWSARDVATQAVSEGFWRLGS